MNVISRDLVGPFPPFPTFTSPNYAAGVRPSHDFPCLASIKRPPPPNWAGQSLLWSTQLSGGGLFLTRDTENRSSGAVAHRAQEVSRTISNFCGNKINRLIKLANLSNNPENGVVEANRLQYVPEGG